MSESVAVAAIVLFCVFAARHLLNTNSPIFIRMDITSSATDTVWTRSGCGSRIFSYDVFRKSIPTLNIRTAMTSVAIYSILP